MSELTTLFLRTMGFIKVLKPKNLINVWVVSSARQLEYNLFFHFKTGFFQKPRPGTLGSDKSKNGNSCKPGCTSWYGNQVRLAVEDDEVSALPRGYQHEGRQRPQRHCSFVPDFLRVSDHVHAVLPGVSY